MVGLQHGESLCSALMNLDVNRRAQQLDYLELIVCVLVRNKGGSHHIPNVHGETGS